MVFSWPRSNKSVSFAQAKLSVGLCMGKMSALIAMSKEKCSPLYQQRLAMGVLLYSFLKWYLLVLFCLIRPGT